MDPYPTSRRLTDRGVSSVQFVVAAGLGLILFLVLANLVVVQYGRGAVRSALEQGARAGTVGGPVACEQVVGDVIADLLGGAMSDDLTVSCVRAGPALVASARATFASWTPLTPDFEVELSSQAIAEP